MGRTSELSGIAAMLAATASFVVCDSFMKVVAEDLPPFEVLFLRGIAATAACAVLLALRREGGALSGVRNGRALLRAAAETFSVLCYIVALARMPIADAISIIQTAPLILILGAALVLRERIGPARIVLVLVGFAGALMVAQPGSSGISLAALLALASAVLIAARDLIGRGVPTRIPVTVVAFATTIMVMAVSAALSLSVETWTAPTSRHLAFLGAAGLFVTLGHAGLLAAYRLGPTTLIAPFFYSFAPWAVLSGLIVWGALPNPVALGGIVLISVSGVANVLLDPRRGRSAVPPRSTDALSKSTPGQLKVTLDNKRESPGIE
ncbi:MAG TPA: DMT family transporter [Burkholderiaceae bacterium]|nr:DMT family transporter [Burkholderiaceae bacterium]